MQVPGGGPLGSLFPPGSKAQKLFAPTLQPNTKLKATFSPERLSPGLSNKNQEVIEDLPKKIIWSFQETPNAKFNKWKTNRPLQYLFPSQWTDELGACTWCHVQHGFGAGAPGYWFDPVTEKIKGPYLLEWNKTRALQQEELKLTILTQSIPYLAKLRGGAAGGANLTKGSGSGGIHIDIGGEGFHPNAINVNNSPIGTVGGTNVPAGQPIPNLLLASGENIPLPNGVAKLITIEGTPISQAMASEAVRLTAPGGQIVLYHPADYALTGHLRVIQAAEGGLVRTITLGQGDQAFTITVINIPGG